MPRMVKGLWEAYSASHLVYVANSADTIVDRGSVVGIVATAVVVGVSTHLATDC